jgi:hypothetical protein
MRKIRSRARASREKSAPEFFGENERLKISLRDDEGERK